MSRSLWKGVYIDKCFLKKTLKKNFLYIWSRRSVIPYTLINSTVLVYNGKNFRKVLITRDKVGFKFGEFVNTRARPSFKSSKKK